MDPLTVATDLANHAIVEGIAEASVVGRIGSQLVVARDGLAAVNHSLAVGTVVLIDSAASPRPDAPSTA